MVRLPAPLASTWTADQFGAPPKTSRATSVAVPEPASMKMASAPVAEARPERFTNTVPDPGESTTTAVTLPVTEPEAVMDTSPDCRAILAHIPRPTEDVTEPDTLIDVAPVPRLST